MADVEAEGQVAASTPALPDYVTDPDAILKDKDVEWRYGRAPDYSKTRAMYADTKQMSHEPGSLPDIVQNLVKNWEVEASFKPRLSDWRTIDPENYSFAINGGPAQSAHHMLRVGTYNAIISANEYYDPKHSDFASSHKTFKRMMPFFAWEVLEVYSGPPVVAFRWRHWGPMKNDYVGFNNKGEKVTAKAHGGQLDIQGVTVAHVDDKIRLQKVETWFDPMDMFRQIAPGGIVNKQPVMHKSDGQNHTTDEARESPTSAALDQASLARNPTTSLSGCPFLASSPNLPPGQVETTRHTTSTAQTHPPDSTDAKPSERPPHQGVPQHPDVPNDEIVWKNQWTPGSEDPHKRQEQELPRVQAPTEPRGTLTEQGASEVPIDMVNCQDMPMKVGGDEASVSTELAEHAGLSDVLAEQSPVEGATSSNGTESWSPIEVPSEQSMDEHMGERSSHSIDKDVGETGEQTSMLQSSRSMDEEMGELVSVPPELPNETMEKVQPGPGEAVAAPSVSPEARLTHEEMSNISELECPFLMNRE